MSNRRPLRIILIISIFLGTLRLSAQTTDALGTYSPYSMFGIGEIEKGGTAFNYSMGGIGIGIRDNRFINYLNPASITERDTLSFMLDFGVHQKNFYNLALPPRIASHAPFGSSIVQHGASFVPLVQMTGSDGAAASGMPPSSHSTISGYSREPSPPDPRSAGRLISSTSRRRSWRASVSGRLKRRASQNDGNSSVRSVTPSPKL